MLADVEHVSGGAHFAVFRCPFHALHRDVLELEGEHVDAPGEIANRLLVLVSGHHLKIRELTRGGVRVGRKCVDPVPHAARGDGEHAPQLAAAHDAHCAAGKKNAGMTH